MALRRHPDGKFDLKLYFRPNSRTFLFSALLDDYDYDAYITASLGERTVIKIFIEKNGNARAKESYAEIIKSHREREAAEKAAQTMPSSDPVEQLASTVEKLSLGTEPQPSISIPPQSSKTLIMSSTSSSVEVDPSRMEDKVLFPLIYQTVNREERRRLMSAMPQEQKGRFLTWHEQNEARKEKLRLLQEEKARLEEEKARLKQRIADTLTTYSEQSFDEINSDSRKIFIHNGY